MDQERYQHLLSFMYCHAGSEPGRPPKNLTFQDRLVNPQVSPEMRNALAPYEDLEEEDDIAEQEMEQEEQQTSSGKTASVLLCNVMSFKICVNILACEC